MVDRRERGLGEVLTRGASVEMDDLYRETEGMGEMR